MFVRFLAFIPAVRRANSSCATFVPRASEVHSFMTMCTANSSYPAALATHQHRAKAYLPEPIARALHTRPELIQRAVEGFYVRDPAQLRVRTSPPNHPLLVADRRPHRA